VQHEVVEVPAQVPPGGRLRNTLPARQLRELAPPPFVPWLAPGIHRPLLQRPIRVRYDQLWIVPEDRSETRALRTRAIRVVEGEELGGGWRENDLRVVRAAKSLGEAERVSEIGRAHV